MKYRSRILPSPGTGRSCLLAAVLCCGALAGKSQAAAVITGNASFNVSTSNYTYTYSVMNTGLDDLVLVSVRSFSPLGVSGPFAPSGFSLAFDPSQGWANFMEDGSILTPETFAPGSTVGLFTFTSPYGPGPADFVAYDVSGTEYTGLTVAPVPEPAGILTASGVAFLAAWRRRRSPSSITL